MIEVGTAQTEWVCAIEEEEIALTERLATARPLGIAEDVG